MIPNDILLYSQVNAYCHQDGVIQQLMGAETKNHSQTLGRARVTQQKRGREDCKSQRGQGHHENITHRIK